MHKVGVAVVGFAISKGQLAGLSDQVNIGRAIVPQGAQIIAFQQTELLQEDRPLAPGTALEHLIAPVLDRGRRLYPGGKGGQVIQREESPMALGKGHNPLGDVAAIKRLSRGLQPGRTTLRSGSALSVQQEREGLGQVRVAPDLSNVWQAPLRHIELRGGGPLLTEFVLTLCQMENGR